MNPVELKYYPFVISLNKCTGSCNVLPANVCISKETKDINLKAFNMITNKDEAKAMMQHISCDCKCEFNITTCNWKQKWNNETSQCEYKIIVSAKKIFSDWVWWNYSCYG